MHAQFFSDEEGDFSEGNTLFHIKKLYIKELWLIDSLTEIQWNQTNIIVNSHSGNQFKRHRLTSWPHQDSLVPGKSNFPLQSVTQYSCYLKLRFRNVSPYTVSVNKKCFSSYTSTEDENNGISIPQVNLERLTVEQNKNQYQPY